MGSSGAILSYIMCERDEPQRISVILGGFGGDTTAAAAGGGATKLGKDPAPRLMRPSSLKGTLRTVIIVPGYTGMASNEGPARQKEMGEKLKAEGVGDTNTPSPSPAACTSPHERSALAEAGALR